VATFMSCTFRVRASRIGRVIVLKGGTSVDRELARWHSQVVSGPIERRDGSVVRLDPHGREVARWNFARAWPSKYIGPDLDARGTDVAIETLELTHEGVTEG
jgi:phage tail-like protein